MNISRVASRTPKGQLGFRVFCSAVLILGFFYRIIIGFVLDFRIESELGPVAIRRNEVDSSIVELRACALGLLPGDFWWKR